MVKTIISASVDLNTLLILKERHVNISAIVNKALMVEAGNTNSIDARVEVLRAEANNIIDKQKEFDEKHKLAQDNKLNDFLNKISTEILNNEVGMIYWSKETGRTIEELRALKTGGSHAEAV